jgi:hypothetical protein
MIVAAASSAAVLSHEGNHSFPGMAKLFAAAGSLVARLVQPCFSKSDASPLRVSAPRVRVQAKRVQSTQSAMPRWRTMPALRLMLEERRAT